MWVLVLDGEEDGGGDAWMDGGVKGCIGLYR